MEWPGNSSDLNQIENLWVIVKKILRNRDSTTKTKLIEAIIQVCFHDQEIKDVCKTLIEYMPRIVNLVIKAKGGHTSN